MVDVSFWIFTPPDVFSWPFFCNGEDKPFEAMSCGRSRGFVFHAASCLFPSLKRRNAKIEPFKASYCFEDRRTTLKIGLAHFLGFGFVRNTKTYRRNTEMRKLSRSRMLHEHRYYFEDRRTTHKIGLAWFFWVWLRSYYKKPQKKHRNAKIEPFKVSYCFEDRRTTLKIGLACLLGFGFVRDTKTYGRNNEMRNMILQVVTWSSKSLCTVATLSKLVWLVFLGLASFVIQKPIEETPKCEN